MTIDQKIHEIEKSLEALDRSWKALCESFEGAPAAFLAAQYSALRLLGEVTLQNLKDERQLERDAAR